MKKQINIHIGKFDKEVIEQPAITAIKNNIDLLEDFIKNKDKNVIDIYTNNSNVYSLWFYGALMYNIKPKIYLNEKESTNNDVWSYFNEVFQIIDKYIDWDKIEE